jgi:hypothetical protein
VLVELGLPYIEGYKPRSNYQGLLATEVENFLDQHPGFLDSLASAPRLNPEQGKQLNAPDLDQIIESPPEKRAQPFLPGHVHYRGLVAHGQPGQVPFERTRRPALERLRDIRPRDLDQAARVPAQTVNRCACSRLNSRESRTEKGATDAVRWTLPCGGEPPPDICTAENSSKPAGKTPTM